MDTPPRIVQVIAPAPFGGAESVVRTLAEELQRAQAEVLVVALTPASTQHPWTQSVQALGVPVRSIAAGMKGYRSEMRQLRDILLEFQPTVVHSHGYRADIASMFATRGRFPWVSTVHGFTHISARASLYQVIDRLALGRAARVVVVASHIVGQLSRWGVRRSRIDVVRNALRPVKALTREAAREQLGIPRDAKVIGWVGRLSSEKGPDLLVDALRLVSKPVVVAVIGEGPARAALEALVQTLPSHIDVRLCGARSDAPYLMRAFDILALSSRTEGMPLVVLEAMAAGTPVVAFDVGDVAQAVNAETGWLSARADTKAFALALEAALGNDGERTAKGRRSEGLVTASFSPDAWTQSHLATYARAAGSTAS